MKQIAFLLAIIALLPACTQNNGNIGPLFGRWQLLEIALPDSSINPEGTLYLSFQNEVVLFQRLADDGHSTHTYFGTFVHTADSLLTNLSHDDHTVLSYFHITDTTTPAFAVKQLDRKRLILAAGDTTWIYRKY